MNLSFLFSETYSDHPGRIRSAHPDWALGDGDHLSLDDPVDLEAGVLAETSDPADCSTGNQNKIEEAIDLYRFLSKSLDLKTNNDWILTENKCPQ
jgi:hypothetical protein